MLAPPAAEAPGSQTSRVPAGPALARLARAGPAGPALARLARGKASRDAALARWRGGPAGPAAGTAPRAGPARAPLVGTAGVTGSGRPARRRDGRGLGVGAAGTGAADGGQSVLRALDRLREPGPARWPRRLPPKQARRLTQRRLAVATGRDVRWEQPDRPSHRSGAPRGPLASVDGLAGSWAGHELRCAPQLSRANRRPCFCTSLRPVTSQISVGQIGSGQTGWTGRHSRRREPASRASLVPARQSPVPVAPPLQVRPLRVPPRGADQLVQPLTGARRSERRRRGPSATSRQAPRPESIVSPGRRAATTQFETSRLAQRSPAPMASGAANGRERAQHIGFRRQRRRPRRSSNAITAGTVLSGAGVASTGALANTALAGSGTSRCGPAGQTTLHAGQADPHPDGPRPLLRSRAATTGGSAARGRGPVRARRGLSAGPGARSAASSLINTAECPT